MIDVQIVYDPGLDVGETRWVADPDGGRILAAGVGTRTHWLTAQLPDLLADYVEGVMAEDRRWRRAFGQISHRLLSQHGGAAPPDQHG
jgi:beta-galactosidase GanA